MEKIKRGEGRYFKSFLQISSVVPITFQVWANSRQKPGGNRSNDFIAKTIMAAKE
jgi:hypothetical protein